MAMLETCARDDKIGVVNQCHEDGVKFIIGSLS